MKHAIVDAGPLVTFCDRRDSRHGWVVETFKNVRGPLLSCEAALAEALYLTRHRADMQDALLAMVAAGMISLPFTLEREVERIRELRRQYHTVPMSLADACLVRLAEVFDDHHVCTFDADFTIYRKYGQETISLISPEPEQ